MSLRSKPLKLVDGLKSCFAPDAGGSARGRPRRLSYRDKMSLRSKPRELVDELESCFAPDAGGSAVVCLCCFVLIGLGGYCAGHLKASPGGPSLTFTSRHPEPSQHCSICLRCLESEGEGSAPLLFRAAEPGSLG